MSTRFEGFRWEPFIIATFFILSAIVCGADPIPTLSIVPTSQLGAVAGQQFVACSTVVLSGRTAFRGSSDDLVQFTQRQTDESSVAKEPDDWKQEIVEEFITGMNPLASLNVRSLDGYYDPFGWQCSYGTRGHQPWRLGWVSYNDFTFLPTSSVSSGSIGQMQILQWNSNVRISELVAPGILFNGTGYFNAQWWNGPSGVQLPSEVDQISTDLEFGFFGTGNWSGQIAFHPQIVDSDQSRLTRRAFTFDGRAIATYRLSPEWSIVGGVAFWDRVDVLVVPHIGVIWSPDEHWELRLLYPKARISYYLGRWSNADFWTYGTLEYTAEAWQTGVGNAPVVTDRIQVTSDQVSVGIRWDRGRYSFFAEAGFVFNRQAKFVGPTPDFTLSDIAMLRIGTRY